MSKIKNSFVCENCGVEHSKWKGQCSFCKEWNSIVEQIINDQTIQNWSNNYDLKEKAESIVIFSGNGSSYSDQNYLTLVLKAKNLYDEKFAKNLILISGRDQTIREV